MFKKSETSVRLKDLEKHLKREHPVLSQVVDGFRVLDHICRRMGYFHREESHATKTSWWPLISILGLYSSGKSSFINHFLGYRLQATGNQAVDDKFTVICYTTETDVRVLPGLALDADPRFPLFKISQAIEEVASGEGERVDAYLQLKTCPSERLRSKILIDSPGFDADAQRTSTLRITDHIIDISDLVLVFFDARHPESGSMRDTLEHLVKRTLDRRDSNKFLFILNQIDATAKEDNTDEVFASWQRALAQSGLTAGTCYALYLPESAIPIEDSGLRTRLESKRDASIREIAGRIEQVGVERAYRIVGTLEQAVKTVDQEIRPLMSRFIRRWRRSVLIPEILAIGMLLTGFVGLTIWGGYWEGLRLELPFWSKMPWGQYLKPAIIGLLVLAAGYGHFRFRYWAARRNIGAMLKTIENEDVHPNYVRAFRKNVRWYRSLFLRQPAGWNKRTGQQLGKILDDANRYIQKLNDMYTNPSGTRPATENSSTAPDPSGPGARGGTSPE
jgi:hypothetical protein